MRNKYPLIWPIIVVVIPFLLYLRTLCPVIYAGDSAEYASVIQLPTIAHPPGNPLYIIFGWLFTRLPLGEPALEANLFSALFGALTCLVLYFCFMRLTVRPVAAAAAAMLFGFGIIFWKLSSVAEVYTLLTFFIALVWLIALLLADGSVRPGWTGFLLLGLLLGLGFAVHQSIIFLLPGLIVFLILKRISVSPGSAIGGTIVGFIIGAAFYLLLIPLSHLSAPGPTEINGIGDLWPYVTRQAYFTRTPEDVGVEFSQDELVTSGDIAGSLISGIWREWGPIFFFFALGGVIYLVIKRRELGWGMVASIVCVFLGMSFLTKGSPLGMPKIDLTTSELIPPLLPLFAFGILATLDGAYEKLLSTDQFVGEESFIPKEKAPAFLAAFYIAFPILLLLFHLGQADMRNHIFVDKMVRNSIEGISPPATIYTIGDEYYPFRYILEVEKPFLSVDGSPADIQLMQGWNLRGVTESGRELNPEESLANKINQDLGSGRGVFLTFLPSEPAIGMLRGAGVHFEHVGLIYEAVPDDAPWAAPGEGPVRFSNPGNEAAIWDSYDTEHLGKLAYIELDPLEKRLIGHYFSEAVNYGDFYFDKGDYGLSGRFYHEAYRWAEHLGRDFDPVISRFAISSYKSMQPITLDLLNYAAEEGIEFPERDPYRANIFLKLNPTEGLKLGRDIYSEETVELLEFELIQSLMAEDIDNEDLDAAEQKAMALMNKTTGALGLDPQGMDKLVLMSALAQDTGAAEAYWYRGYIAVLKDDVDTARVVVKLLLDSNPEFLNNMIYAVVTAGNYENAKLFYEMTIEFEPENWRAMEGLAVCLFGMGEEDEAKEIALEAMEHGRDGNNLKTILGIEIETDDTEQVVDEGSE